MGITDELEELAAPTANLTFREQKRTGKSRIVDGYLERHCSKCQQFKLATQFYKRGAKNPANRYLSLCIPCYKGRYKRKTSPPE